MPSPSGLTLYRWELRRPLLGRIFAQQGYPKVLVSDNGTHFAAKEFQDYCQTNGIQHIRSSPYQPHCNGQAERFIDTFERTLQKLQGEGIMADVLQTFLLTYRTTPCAPLSGLKTPQRNSWEEYWELHWVTSNSRKQGLISIGMTRRWKKWSLDESEGNLLKKMQSLPENTVILIIENRGCLVGSNGDWEDTSTK